MWVLGPVPKQYTLIIIEPLFQAPPLFGVLQDREARASDVTGKHPLSTQAQDYLLLGTYGDFPQCLPALGLLGGNILPAISCFLPLLRFSDTLTQSRV